MTHSKFSPPTKCSSRLSNACGFGEMVGLTGLEPVTLRLSSACSNQLSYRPKVRLKSFPHHPELETPAGVHRRLLLFSKLWLANAFSPGFGPEVKFGGKGIRTPDL